MRIDTKQYTLERKYCNCSPENCCCHKYVVRYPNGDWMTQTYTYAEAKKMVDRLNTKT